MVTSSLRDYLRTAKQQLRECQKSKTPVTLVMGNDKADIDTIAATLIFAYLRSSAPPSNAFSKYYIPLIQVSRSSLSSIMHLPKLLPYLGVEAADLVSLDDMHLDGAQSHLSAEDTHFFLVNWNFLEGRQGENFSRSIEGCVDIHQDSGYVPKQTTDLRIIGQAGSCTSLVVNALREEWQSIGGQSSSDKENWSKHLASLGLAGVLGPTQNLRNATPEDESAYRFLAGAYGNGFERDPFYTSIFGGETRREPVVEPPTYSAPPQALGNDIVPIEQHRVAAEPPTSSGEYMSHNTFTGNRLDPMASETVQTFHEEVLPEHLHGSTGQGLTGTLAQDSGSGPSGFSSTHQSENRGYSDASAMGDSSTYQPSGLIGNSSDNYGSNTSMLGSTTVGGSGNNYTNSTSDPTHQSSMTQRAADAVGLGNTQYGSGSTTSGTGYTDTPLSGYQTSGTSTTGTGYTPSGLIGNSSDNYGSNTSMLGSTTVGGSGNNYSNSTSDPTHQSSMTERAADAVGLGNTQYGSGNTTSGYGDNGSTSAGYRNTSSTGTEGLTDRMRDTTLGSSNTGDYSSTTGTTGRSYAPGTTSSTTTSHEGDASSSGGFLGSVMGALGLGGGHQDSTTGTTGTSSSGYGSSRTGYEGEGVGQQTSLGSGSTSGLGSSSTGDYSSSTGTGYGSTGRDQEHSSGTGSSTQDKAKELIGDAQYGGERSGLGNGASHTKNETSAGHGRSDVHF